MSYDRGAVVKAPDFLGGHDYRPFVRLSDDSHPFTDEEALYAALTTTRRVNAIPLSDDDFVSGGLPKESYVNPWTITPFRHADVDSRLGQLTTETTERIATEAAGYLGME